MYIVIKDNVCSTFVDATGIAEHLGVSRNTIRNWFEHSKYHYHKNSGSDVYVPTYEYRSNRGIRAKD